MDTLLLPARRSIAQRARLEFLKYGSVLRVSIASNLAYISEVFFRALLLIILVFVLTQLWKTTFSLRGARVLSGFTISDMVWYLVFAKYRIWDMSVQRPVGYCRDVGKA